MNITITITFKDGTSIYSRPRDTQDGIWILGYDLCFCTGSQTLYKTVGSVLCGRDITDQVDKIEIVMYNNK